MSTLAVDNFNYTGNLNANWVPENGQTIAIAASGVCRDGAPPAVQGGLYVGNPVISWPSDQWAQITLLTINSSTSNYIGVLLRDSSSVTTNYRIFVAGPLGASATLTIGKENSGTYTQLVTIAGSANIPAGSVLFASVIGNVIRAYINGVLMLQTTDSSVSSGIPGFVIHAVSTSTDAQGSAFSAGNFATQAATPTFNPVAGTYASAQSVIISCSTPSSTIYYTTNGSTPTTSSAVYSSPVSVSVSETLKAIATAPAYTQSAVGSAAYTIGGLPNMPITFYSAQGGSQATNYASPTFRQNVAAFNLILYTNWVGIEGSMGGQTMSSSMADIKTRASALGNSYCLTGCYQIPQEVRTTGAPNTAWFAAMQANHWWLYSGPGAFPGGSIVVDTAYAANEGNVTCNVNGTALSPLATGGWANGLDYCYAAATYEFNYIINGTPQNVGQSAGTCAANPHCDFIVHDNQQWNTRYSGQWLYNSVVYPNGEYGTDVTVYPYQQAGFARLINKWRSLCPNAGSGQTMLQGGNCDVIAGAQANPGTGPVGPIITTPWQHLYDIVFSEGCLGNVGGTIPTCVIAYNSPNAMLGTRMVQQEQLLSTNPRAICVLQTEGGGPLPGTGNYPASQSNWTNAFSTTFAMPTNAGGSHIPTGNYWQGARYALGFALLRGWAFDLGIDDGTFFWLDEYNKSAGGSQAGNYNWLGAPIDGPQSTPWNLGMYRRRFANGTVYLNPCGNGAQNYTLQSGDMKHALPNGGYSDPAVNNGALLTVLSINDCDMRILVP
jgi:Chitobiase/beta-hexosaminidase C-terminal domain